MKSRDYPEKVEGVQRALPGRLFVPLQCGSLKARRRSGTVRGEGLPQSVDAFKIVGNSRHQSLCERCSTVI